MAHSKENTSKAEEIMATNSRLKTERNNIDTKLDNALFYFMPEMGDEGIRESNTGEQDIPFDTTGVNACNKLSAGIYSNTVSMGDEFFGFRTNDSELNESEAVRDFFQKASKTVLKKMQDSNFGQVMAENIHYLSALNTSVCYTEWRDEEGLVFHNIPITQCVISEDHLGKVNTLYREFRMTACQAYERWGENLGPKVLEAYKDPKKKYNEFRFIHAVYPRLDRKADSLLSTDMPFASYYVCEDDKMIVEEGGYQSFPYAVPRFFKSSRSAYGRGPSFASLPVMRELIRLRSNTNDGIEAGINPVIFLDGLSDQGDVDLSPGSVNYFDGTNGITPIFYPSQVDLQGSELRMSQCREEVKQLFYVDVFLVMMEGTKNMTATETSERAAEKIQQITPIVARLYEELFSVVITRCFELCIEYDVILDEDIPEELEELDFKVEYTTKLSNKLKSLEIGQIIKAVQEAATVNATIQEGGLNNYVDVQKMVKNIFVANNIDPDFVYSDAEIAEIQNQEAELMAAQQQEMMMAEQMKPVDPTKAIEEGSPIAEGMI